MNVIADYFAVMRRLAVLILNIMFMFACHFGPASRATSATSASDVAKMTRMLDAGADPNGTESDGATPLMMAAGYGYTNIVKLLLTRGANPRIATSNGITALDLARSGVPDIDRFTVFACQDDTVKALLAADPKLPDHTANLPLPARIAMHAKRCRA